MKQIVIIFMGIITSSTLVTGQDMGDKVFSNDIIHEIRFYSETEPDLLDTLYQDAEDREKEYYLVKMFFDGEEVDSVGLRIKGFLSLSSPQIPLKVDINEYVDGQKFDGLKKFGLSNSFGDSDRQRDRVAYEINRRAGIPSPRTSYAEVYVNDEFLSVYVLVQQIDNYFIKDHFADEGSLNKGGLFPEYGDYFDFLPPQFFIPWKERIQNLDLTSFLKFELINTVLEASDSYPTENYYWYYSEKEDLEYLLPWDHNFTLPGANFYPTLNPDPVSFQDSIWETPEIKEYYLTLACETSQYLLDDDYIDELVNNNHAIISSNSQNQSVADPAAFREIIRHRKEWLNQQIIDEGVVCPSLDYPYDIGDLVINEFVAKSDSTNGVQEPDGGTPDWIELYNNTDQDITLDRKFYLSNDIDFPKKWSFKNSVTIPAKSYQIIWADRDVHQQGVHSNFKIKKSGGDLILFYEDLTMIDLVSYTNQELNKGYARVPNGVGDFKIQEPTFNSNNDMTTSINSMFENELINIYPNPSSRFVNISTEAQIDKMAIYSTTGQLILDNIDTEKSIDLLNIPSGNYFLNIYTGQNQATYMIMKH